MNGPTAREPRRVALVVSTPDRRGAEVFAVELAERLRRDGGWSPQLAALDAPGAERPFEHIAVLGEGRRSWRTWRGLLRLARDNEVLVANGGTTLLPVAIASALTRTPFVYRNIGDPTVWGAVRFAKVRLGWPTRRAARVIALYPAAGEELRRRYRLDDAAIVVIGNAASAERFRPPTAGERRAARLELGLDPDRRWVAYVGALSAEKRPELAIDAVLADENLGLVVVGVGPLRDACERRAAAAADRIKILGRRSDVTPILHAVDALVISSTTEGVSGAAIEAGLSGLPVVTTAVGGMADLVVHEQTGLVVDDPTPQRLAEALRTAVDGRERLGAAAQRRCNAHFEFDSVAARWSEQLRAVCEGSRR